MIAQTHKKENNVFDLPDSTLGSFTIKFVMLLLMPLALLLPFYPRKHIIENQLKVNWGHIIKISDGDMTDFQWLSLQDFVGDHPYELV